MGLYFYFVSYAAYALAFMYCPPITQHGTEEEELDQEIETELELQGGEEGEVQEYLAHKKQHPPRTLQ